MSQTGESHPFLRVALSAGLLVLLLALALIPNTGALPAAANCQYGGCESTSSTSSGLWYGLLAALVIVAAALGVLLLMRRRRARPGGPGPVEPWAGESGAVAATAGPEGPSPSVEPMDVAPEVPPGASAYTEGPEDVGAVAATGAAAAPAAESGEADIDSLMQELDKISGEILKKGPPKKGSAANAPPDDEGTAD